MTQEEKDFIEIPFGAKDSELIEATYYIPEGMEAVIEDNKVVIRKKESEDDKIYRTIQDIVHLDNEEIRDLIESRNLTYSKVWGWLEENMIRNLCVGRADVLTEKKPVEWSEEDENIKNTLIASLVRISANTRTDSTSVNYSFIKEINWLKSLKKRLQ